MSTFFELPALFDTLYLRKPSLNDYVFHVDHQPDIAAEVHDVTRLIKSYLKGRVRRFSLPLHLYLRKKIGPTRLRTFATDLCPRTMHDRNRAQHNKEHHQSAQQLVRNARRHIIEPVLASFDLASDSYDAEQLSMAPDPTHEKEKLPWISLRNKGGLTVHVSGVHIRWDIGDESADIDNAKTNFVPSAEPLSSLVPPHSLVVHNRLA